ncbi:MAG TPA: alpha/beta fold hydrolase [Anaerolineales bacterium]
MIRQLALTLTAGMLALAAACGQAPAPAPVVRASTWTPTASATASPAPAPTQTGTPDPYAGLTIADLSARSYGPGELVVDQRLAAEGGFDRVLFHYPSDGLTVHGFMNLPAGEGPLPVVVVLHGYVSPLGYETLAYSGRYADALAEAGFLVLHPNYRDYPPSDVGPNPFRIGYATDVLNLLAIVRQTAGAPGPLAQADGQSIGLFGHSMGGGIGLRAITVDPQIRAAVLYGSMSGDERLNYEKIVEWSGGRAGWAELNTTQADLRRISPIDHLDRIEAAVSLHHGELDETVPPIWSEDLCQRLAALDKPVECFSYSRMPHTFYGEGERLLLERAIAFFDQHLR